LRRHLRGDLDTILAKALKKDPQERYASVALLADDLQRWLKHEPISVRPDSAIYHLGKYVRRHRAGVAIASALLVLLIGFALVQSVQLRRIARARDRADRIAEFMTGIFKISDPNEHSGQAVTARAVLDKAAQDIQNNLSDDPELRAQMLHVMGRAYLNLGLFSRAESLFRQGIRASQSFGGQDNRDTLNMTHDLAWAVLQEGRLSEAESIERKLLETQRRVLGPEHGDTLATMEELAFTVCNEGKGQCAEGIELTRHLLQQRERKQGPDAFYTLATMNNLAIMLASDGRVKEAIDLQQESLNRHLRKFGPDNIGTVNAMLELGEMQRDAGQDDNAEATLEKLLTIENRAFAPEQGETAATKYDLASVLLRKGQPDRAVALLREALNGDLAPRIAQGLPTDPLFASFRNDPRFKELLTLQQKRFPTPSPAKTD
jgi:tetratricopeptide (TPR) repeat protein